MHHSIQINEKACHGCTHCMKQCPVGAIRIRDGHAKVTSSLCINCGQCLDVCPHGAIHIDQTLIGDILAYKARIAVVPAVFFGQFKDEFDRSLIIQTLFRLGFTHVYLAETGVDILNSLGISPHSAAGSHVVSSFCPAVTKLIQLRYPLLLENLDVTRSPAQMTAIFARCEAQDQGYADSEIGVFYITPCAAQMSLIKTAGSDDARFFQGVLNMSSTVNLVRSTLVKHKTIVKEIHHHFSFHHFTSRSVLWSLAGGEKNPGTRTLAVDEIHNVIDFLELLEGEEESNVGYLELEACAEGCVGGVLTTRNRFLAEERLRHWAQSLPPVLDEESKERILRYKDTLTRYVTIETPTSSDAMVWDTDRAKALHKLENSREITKSLPGIDCGLCGSPTCKALAGDIARAEASIRQCVVLKLHDPKQLNSLARIWGKTLPQSGSGDA